MMRITRDKLQLLTGILALAFGIYCLMIVMGMIAFNTPEMDVFLFVLSVIFTIIYILYGIFILLVRRKHVNNFIGIGVIAVFWFPWNIGWYAWPMIIMPFIILILSIVLTWRQISGRLRQGLE